jgi:FkbM family methyltransferase
MISEIFSNQDGDFIIFPNDAIAQHIKQNKPWEPHFKTVIEHFISPGYTVIDCGANFGYNAVLMGKRLNNQGLLVAFEPQRIIHQQLNGNLILNNIFNSLTYQIALGDGTQTKTTMRPVNYEDSWVNIGDTSIGEGGEEVNVYALDDFEFDKVNFIKIDVQGYELFTLNGAKKLLNDSQPDLFIEIEPHQLIKFDITEIQLIDYVKSLGYRMFKINNEYPCDHICTINNMDKIEILKDILPLVEV